MEMTGYFSSQLLKSIWRHFLPFYYREWEQEPLPALQAAHSNSTLAEAETASGRREAPGHPMA